MLLEPDEEFLIVNFNPGLSDFDRSFDDPTNPDFDDGGDNVAPEVDAEFVGAEISKTEVVDVDDPEPSIPVESLILLLDDDDEVEIDVFPPIIVFVDFDLSEPAKRGRFEFGDPGDFLCPNDGRSKSCFRFFEVDPPPPPPDDPSFRSNFLLSSSDKLLRTSLFQSFEFESRFESGGLTSRGMISMPPCFLIVGTGAICESTEFTGRIETLDL